MNTLLDIINTLDAIFTVQAGLVFAVVVVCVLAAAALRKPAVVTHYMRTDMVDMVLSAEEYTVFLKAGDIRGEWKPVINGKFLPLDAGVLESYTEMCAAYAEEAEAHYAQEALDNEIVECSGMCLCENLYVFTTTNKLSADVDYCTMIACNHCPVCNPDGIMDVVEDTKPVLRVVSCELLRENGNDYIVRYNDGTYSEVTWDAECDMYEPMNKFGVIQDITVAQANALEKHTGKTVIPF